MRPMTAHMVLSAMLAWTPEPGVWSFSQCLGHLVLTQEAFGDKVPTLIADSSRNVDPSPDPFPHSLVGRFFLWSVRPDNRRRFNHAAFRFHSRNLDDRPSDISVQDF